jgi:hypothetical protein
MAVDLWSVLVNLITGILLVVQLYWWFIVGAVIILAGKWMWRNR